MWVIRLLKLVPVNFDVDKTESIAYKYWSQWDQGIEIGYVRNLQFQVLDGDDDRNDPVAKCFQSAFTHISSNDPITIPYPT